MIISTNNIKWNLVSFRGRDWYVGSILFSSGWHNANHYHRELTVTGKTKSLNFFEHNIHAFYNSGIIAGPDFLKVCFKQKIIQKPRRIYIAALMSNSDIIGSTIHLFVY